MMPQEESVKDLRLIMAKGWQLKDGQIAKIVEKNIPIL